MATLYLNNQLGLCWRSTVGGRSSQMKQHTCFRSTIWKCLLFQFFIPKFQGPYFLDGSLVTFAIAFSTQKYDDWCLFEVYEIRFWMMLLGASSPKPTDVYSNGSWISGLNIGPLTKDFKQKNSKLQTTRQSLSINIIYMHSDGIHVQYQNPALLSNSHQAAMSTKMVSWSLRGHRDWSYLRLGLSILSPPHYSLAHFG